VHSFHINAVALAWMAWREAFSDAPAVLPLSYPPPVRCVQCWRNELSWRAQQLGLRGGWLGG
jgi:hypothetical protein